MTVSLIQNTESHKKWFEPLGKLVINFGTIEFIVNYCLGECYDEVKSSSPFSKRIKKLIDFVKTTNITVDEKSKFIKLLNDAHELFKTRNTILHAPIIGGKTKSENKDCLIFVDVSNDRTILLTEINDIIDKSNKIGSDLYGLFEFLNKNNS